MKILVDENIDEAFPECMPGHDIVNVNQLGWQGTKNGEHLSRADLAGFKALITADKGMP